jgi:ABC-type bacteriocin/lantibiotic exporter with double-glycine peptidase domain
MLLLPLFYFFKLQPQKYNIFFDEATNSLDANNEKEIMNNLDCFFEGKTVMIIVLLLIFIIFTK